MAIPDYQSLMLPVVQVLAASEECRTTDLVHRMEEQFGLSVDERAQLLPSGRQTVIANRTHWAIAYLNKAGLIERTKRAHYRLTDRGRHVLARRPGRIDLKLLAQFPELTQFRGRAPGADGSPRPTPGIEPGTTPEDSIRVAHREILAVLTTLLLDRIAIASPAFFERVVVRLLVAMGFGGGAAAAIGRGGDNGLDGVIDQDALGLDRVYIQAKRYGRDDLVGPNAIRDFFGSLDIAKASKGVFITTSSFTKQARETADRLGKRIVLIDGEQLAMLLIRHDVGVRVEETFYLKKIDEDFFLDE